MLTKYIDRTKILHFLVKGEGFKKVKILVNYVKGYGVVWVFHLMFIV
jgi:hypothetical protein